MSGYPSVKLVATAASVAPRRALPLRVELTNPTPEPLHGAHAELTLEVERGVLVTWDLELVDSLPAGGHVDDALVRARPVFELPANVAAGAGRFALVLRAADGSYLAEDRLELPVTAG